MRPAGDARTARSGCARGKLSTGRAISCAGMRVTADSAPLPAGGPGTAPPAPLRHGERRPVRTLLILAGYYAFIQLYLWWVLPLNRLPLTIAGGLFILGMILLDPLARRESAAGVGLGFGQFLPAARALLPGALLLAALTVALGLLVPGGGRGARFGLRVWNILPWALLQQTLLQATFNRRLSHAFGPGWCAALINGACFSLMHLPGALLTAVTLVTGAWWSRIYQKKPNLWALVLCHALLSALAQSWLPGAWTHGFRVGPGWYRWHG